MRYLLAVGLAAWLLANSTSTPLPPFSDATLASRIDFQFEAGKTPDKYLIEAMGGDIAMMNADGDGSFRDITNLSGLRGSGYGDNDGKPGLYASGLGADTLYRNQGGVIFADTTAQSGATGSGWSTSAGFIDFDHDGKLDLFVARYLDWDFGKNKACGGETAGLRAYSHPNEFAAVTHLLYRNLGACKFEDVSVKAGITKSPGKGLGVAFDDMDRDGWPDIFVANDSFPQQLFHNRHDGTVEEIALPLGLAYDDNDRWKDIFVAQAHVMDNIEITQSGIHYRETPLLLRNTDAKFVDVSTAAGAPFQSVMAARGAAFGDLNSGGAVDVVVATNSGPPRVLNNNATDGIGAAIRIVGASGGYLSSHDRRMHFGLGQDRELKLIEIRWPGGPVQTWKHIASNQIFIAGENTQ